MPTETITKQLTGLTQGTEYEYRVIALGDGTTYTDSDPSTTASFTTLIKLATPAPTLIKDTDSITATWASVNNATSYVVAYKEVGGSWTETTVNEPAHSYEKNDLAEGVSYVFKVKAVSSQTTVYEESDFSSEVTETTQTTLGVPIPTITRTTERLTVSWSSIQNATSYVVAYKTGNDAYTEVPVPTSENPSYYIDNLSEGVTYIFKVKATTTNTSYAESGFSSEVTGTTQITLGTPTFTLYKTTNSITPTWSKINNATGYVVAYKTGAGSYMEVPVPGGDSTSYELDGLSEGVTYTFKVKATSTNDNYVESSYSSEASETTLVTLATPTGIVVSSITTNSATISWNEVEHNSGYRIEYRRKGDPAWTPVNVSGD